VSYSETGATHSQALDASTMESFANTGGSRPRYDSNQLLTLPAPLALNRPGGSSTSVARSNDDVYSDNSSHQRIASPASNTTEQPVEDYFGASASASARHASPRRASHGTVRQTTSPARFPGENANPFQSNHDSYYGVEDIASSSSPSLSGGQPRVRGVSLSDNGPVPGPDGVRRISRPSGRRTSQPPQQNRYSRTTSIYGNLPPGAGAPTPNGGPN
jgi:chitin synthase